MICKSATINQNVVKENYDEVAKARANVVFIAPWNVPGAPVNPNAITLNSY
jgi:hypothetical protein